MFPIQIGAAARCAAKRAIYAEGRLGRVLRGPACDYLPCGRRTCEVFLGGMTGEYKRKITFQTAIHEIFIPRKLELTCYKKELNTVVRKLEFLAHMQPNWQQTSSVLWTLYCRVSLRGRCAQNAAAKKHAAKSQKTTVRHFGFAEKICWFSCTICMSILEHSPTCKKPQDPPVQASLCCDCIHVREVARYNFRCQSAELFFNFKNTC